jgi:hypothetical protein
MIVQFITLSDHFSRSSSFLFGSQCGSSMMMTTMEATKEVELL